jgi:Lrp/AsnC family transcriptional regulator for asnA, asnC and gidA
MRDAGALQIAAIIDPMAIKYKVDAIIGVNVASPNLPRVVAERLSALEQTTYIFWVAGRFDLLVEVVCSSDQAFEQFIEEQLCQQTDVSQFEIMSGIKMFKNQFILRDAIP